MFTWIFLKAISERALRTFAQTLGALLAAEGLTVGVHQVDWAHFLSVSALALVLSLVTSVATAGATNGSPAIGDAETLKRGL